jgi:hypothetical protein
MRVAIFIRSYSSDAAWLTYCLRSIRKFCTGFAYVLVTVPDRDAHIFAPMQSQFGIRLHTYQVTRKPMLSSEVQLCHADSICPDVDAVCTLDSDCLYYKPASPLDNLLGGRPILRGQAFELLARENNPGVIWQGAAEMALGWKPEYECMCHPTIFLCKTFAPFRACVEKHTGRRFDDYVLSCQERWPQSFAELTSLGAFAMRTGDYFFADMHGVGKAAITDSGEPVNAHKLKQFWSKGPMPTAELEAILE